MKKKKKTHHRKRPEPGTAIVKAEVVSPTVIRSGRERELTQTEIDLVHRTVAKGTDADQFALFLWFCRKHGLDPVAKEVYCLLFQVTKHHQDFECPGLPTCRLGRGNESGMWHPGKEMVILTGIGGLRGLAARNHPTEYGSTDDPEYSFVSGKTTTSGKSIPDSCTVRVWKNGAQRPTSATVYWEEYAPNDLADDRAKFWRNMPKNQLAKCAEGQALKKAYPDLANIYVTEELARRISEQTPEGRDIRYPQDRLQAGSHEASQKVLEEKLAGQRPLHQPTTIDVPSQPMPHDQPSKASTGKLPESAYNKDNVPPATKAEPWKYNGMVEIDYSNEAWPIVRGDLAAVLEELKKACPTMDWGKDEFWHVQPRDLEALKRSCVQVNYEIKEIFPKAEAKPTTKTKATSTKPKANQESAGPRLAKGIITRCISGMTGKNNPLRNVTMLLPDKRKPTFSCFDTGLFEWLDKGNGKEAELYVQTRGKYTNIVGLKFCAGKEFVDGKTPVVQRKDQEAGSKTLFGT